MNEIDALRARSEELDGETTEEALDVNHEILALLPGDAVATNRLGRALLNLGDFDAAIAIFETGILADPGNDIARRRLAEARSKASGTLAQAAVKSVPMAWRMDPRALVGVCLEGPGRDACIRICAASIRAAQQIDSTRLAVTPIKTGPRFRVIGGIFTGVAPWRQYLCVAIRVADKALIGRIEAVGGYMVNPPPPSVPSSCNMAIPRGEVAGLNDDLLPSHVEHLKASIDVAPPTHMNKHDPVLRDFILAEADRLS